jgi:hypothetical protein
MYCPDFAIYGQRVTQPKAAEAAKPQLEAK